MGAVWAMVEQWRRLQPVEFTSAQLARAFGVSQSNLSSWQAPKQLPPRESVGAIARVIDRPYRDVLEAFLTDLGHNTPPTLDEIEAARLERKKQGRKKLLLEPLEVKVRRGQGASGQN